MVATSTLIAIASLLSNSLSSSLKDTSSFIKTRYVQETEGRKLSNYSATLQSTIETDLFPNSLVIMSAQTSGNL